MENGIQVLFTGECAMTDNQNVVRGYCFGTAEDARQEVKKIEYLEKHMDYGKPENILLVYRKAIETRVFRTPVGWEYLRSLQEKLAECKDLEEPVPPVMLYTVFAHRVGDDIRVPAPRLPERKKKDYKGRFFLSVSINLILAISVGVMFFIALTGDQPNILNYERTLVNKYAAWEQELTEKENMLRERERQMTVEE